MFYYLLCNLIAYKERNQSFITAEEDTPNSAPSISVLALFFIFFITVLLLSMDLLAESFAFHPLPKQGRAEKKVSVIGDLLQQATNIPGSEIEPEKTAELKPRTQREIHCFSRHVVKSGTCTGHTPPGREAGDRLS